MAYKRSNGKLRRRKIQPAVTVMKFSTPAVSAGQVGSSYIDLSQCASIMNRRFYRQGINWVVSGIKIFSDVGGTVYVRKLPDTWVMRNAYTKAFAHWQKMNEESLDGNESIKPKFLDFKIYADDAHHQAGFDGNLLPQQLTYDGTATPPTVGAVAAVPGEWVASKVIIPTSITAGTATGFEMIATGASFPGAGASTLDAVSLIEGYAASRGLPYQTDPNVPADADDIGPTATPENWLGAMQNDGTGQDSAVVGDMISENNQAPYPYEGDGIATDTQYPGGANQVPGLQLHDEVKITATTVGGMTMVKGGTFGCGLINIIHAPTDAGNISLQVELVPGDHRGYLCEPMIN